MGLIFDTDKLAVYDAIRPLNPRGLHNFCIGTLETYFGLRAAEPAQIMLFDGLLSVAGLAGPSKIRHFAFDGCTMHPSALELLRRSGPITAVRPLGMRLGKPTKSRELIYDISKVLDVTAYPNARKRHKRLVYPTRWMEREKITFRHATAADLPQIAVLHDAWVAMKMAQPDTFKIMFPKRRYLNCVLIGIAQPQSYFVFVAERGGSLCAVRVIFVQDALAFDLAFFANTWDKTLSNLTEAVALATMHALRDHGATHLNCGNGLHTKLEAFKMHWPHDTAIVFNYARSKQDG